MSKMRKKTTKKKKAALPTQTTFRYTPEAAATIEAFVGEASRR